MKKSEAIDIFGNVRSLADALGITQQAVYLWPETLRQDQVDRVIGAGLRLGRLSARRAATLAARGVAR